MSNIRKHVKNVTSVQTPYGMLHVWLDPNPHANKDCLYVEIDEDEGGFTIPDMRTMFTTAIGMYSYNRSGLWSIHNGFFINDQQRTGLAHRIGRRKAHTSFKFYDLEVELLSNELYNMLLAGVLPISIDPVYVAQAQQSNKDFYAEVRALEAASLNLKNLREKFHTEAKAALGDTTYASPFPKVRVKYS